MKKKFEKVKQGANRLAVKLSPSQPRSHSSIALDPGSSAQASSSWTHEYASPKAPPTALSTTGSVVQEFLAAARDGADLCLPLKAALVGAVKIFEICERTAEVREQYNTLKSRLAHLGAVTGVLSQRSHPDSALIQRLDDIAKYISRLTACIKAKEARGIGRRVLESRADIDEIKDLLAKISTRIEAFVYESVIRVEMGIEAILAKLPTVEEKKLERDLAEWSAIAKVIRSALGGRRVYDATHEAQPSGSGCMVGTRVGLLSTCIDWIKNNSKGVFWLAGMAGTGKTSIAISLCRVLAGDPDVLVGGTFFCSRTANQEGRTDVRRILPTLAALLAEISPEFALELAAELKPNSGAAVHKPTSEQFGPLLQRPLEHLASESRPIVFVIDALDECSDERELSELLKAIAAFKCATKVKFILTSRPETHILGGPISNQTRNEIFHLHTIGPEDVNEDIHMYIGNMFAQHPLAGSEAWYSESDVRALALLANGIFIFASTVIAYVLDTAAIEHRRARLHTVLSAMNNSKVATGPLDEMYEFVITRASSTASVEPHELAHTQQVLACILAARMPLSLNALAELLGQTPDVLRASLRRLRAVVHVPNEPDQPGLHSLHASFGDYLFERAAISIRLGRSLGDYSIARGCLQVMGKRLHFNVSRSSSSYQPNPSLKPAFIALSLEYACLHWIYHVSGLPEPSSFDELINQIFRPRVLFWLEVMSVLGHVRRAAAMLMFAVKTARMRDLSRFLHDANMFVAASERAIECSAPHIYISALPLAAQDSLIYQTFYPLCTGLIFVNTYGIDRHGGRLVMTLTGHEARVTSAAYSSNGHLIGSGSTDGTVRIWDPFTGDEIMPPLRSDDGQFQSLGFTPDGDEVMVPLRSDGDQVHTIGFTPDDARLASGTLSGVIHIWNLFTSQASSRRLLGHAGWVHEVIFSPDGSLLASASADKTVRIWNIDKDHQPVVIRGHTEAVFRVVFTPDGRTLVSCSGDQTIRFWHPSTGTPIGQPIHGHDFAIRNISLSNDGTTLAAGSDDGRIRLWDPRTRAIIATLRGPLPSITRMQFAPDGRSLVACESANVSVCTPQPNMIEYSSVLIGTDPSVVDTVAFSPDGLYIVSSSDDANIRIWDAGNGSPAIHPLQAHDGDVSSIAISSHGTVIVSGSYDRTVGVWNMRTGRRILPPLLGHTESVYSVALSSDGCLIASGSQDHTVRLWDARTGAPVCNPLLGHTHWVVAVAFSSNAQLLASGSYDNSVRIWDVATGQPSSFGPLVCGNTVYSVTFSPNGRVVAAGDGDGNINLWHSETGWPACPPLRAQDYGIGTICFSPDGTRILSGGDDYVIYVWDIATGRPVLALEGHIGQVYSVACSSDSRFIASGSLDTTIKLWDFENGTLLITLYGSGHNSIVNSVGFTPDCRSIVSGSSDRTIRVWDIAAALNMDSSRNSLNPIDAPAFTEVVDGWLTGPSGELLLWIPDAYRSYLQAPVCTTLIGRHRVIITADPRGLHAGEDWTSCWGSAATM